MDETRWPTEWVRGVLPLCVLALVARHGPQGTHGYAVAQQLAEEGLGQVKGGTLYPVLNRLEADGLVTSRWEAGEGGPGRKTFTATREGEHELASRRRDWQTFIDRAAALVGAEPRSST